MAPGQTPYGVRAKHADLHHDYYSMAARNQLLNERLQTEMAKTQQLGESTNLADVSASQVSRVHGEGESHKKILSKAGKVHEKLSAAIKLAEEHRTKQDEAATASNEGPEKEVRRIRQGAAQFLIATKKQASPDEQWVLSEDGQTSEGLVRPSATLSLRDLQWVMNSRQAQYTTCEVWGRTVTLHNEATKVTADYSKLERDYEALESAKQSVAQQRIQAQREADSTKDQLEQERKAHAASKGKLESTRKEMQDYTSPSDLDAKLEARQHKCELDHQKTSRSKDAEHNEKLAAANRAREKAELERSKLEERCNGLDQQLKTSESSLSECRADLEKAKLEKNSMQSKASAGDKEKNKRIDELQESLNDSKRNAEQLVKDRDEHKRMADYHGQNASDLRTELGELKGRFATLEPQLETDKAEIGRLKKIEVQFTELKKASEVASSETNSIVEANQHLKRSLARVEADAELQRNTEGDLRSQVTDLKGDLEEVNVRVQSGERVIKVLNNTVASKEAAFKNAESDLSRAQQDIKKHQGTISQLQSLLAAISGMVSEYDGDDVSDKVDALKANLVLTEQNLKQSEVNIEQAQGEISRLTEEKQKSDKARERAEQASETADSARQQSEETVKTANCNRDAADKARVEAETERDEAVQARKKADEARLQADKTRVQAEQERDNALKGKATATGQAEQREQDAQSTLSEARAEIKSLTEAKDAADEAKRSAEKEASAAQERVIAAEDEAKAARAQKSSAEERARTANENAMASKQSADIETARANSAETRLREAKEDTKKETTRANSAEADKSKAIKDAKRANDSAKAASSRADGAENALLHSKQTTEHVTAILRSFVLDDDEAAAGHDMEHIAGRICEDAALQLDSDFSHQANADAYRWSVSMADLSEVSMPKDPIQSLWLTTCFDPGQCVQIVTRVEQALHMHITAGEQATEKQWLLLACACRNMARAIQDSVIRQHVNNLCFATVRCLELAFRLRVSLPEEEEHDHVIFLRSTMESLRTSAPLTKAIAQWLHDVHCGNKEVTSPLRLLQGMIPVTLRCTHSLAAGPGAPNDDQRSIAVFAQQLWVVDKQANHITVYWMDEVKLSMPTSFCVEISFLKKRRILGMVAKTERPFRTDLSGSLDWLIANLPDHIEDLDV